MTPHEMIAVIAGFTAGKKVERRFRTDPYIWEPVTDVCHFDFGTFEFRLGPEPVPPGDLTYEEAEALRQQGVPMQFWHTFACEWRDRPENMGRCSDNDAYRRTPDPIKVCACGHEWHYHGSRGCWKWIDKGRGYCSCKAKPFPTKLKRMVPLSAAIDLVNETARDLIRDLTARCEEATP